MSASGGEVIPIISKVIKNSIGLINDNTVDINDNRNLIKFITSYDLNVLIITISNKEAPKKVHLSTDLMETIPSNSNVILLIKNKSCIITKENVHAMLTIITSNVGSNIAKQFKMCLNNLYIPFFNSNQRDIAQSLTAICDNLEINSDDDQDDKSLSKILSIDDEIKYWKLKQKTKKEAKLFYELLNPLKGKFNKIENMNVESILNIINELNDILHLLWTEKGNYPNHRMRHLLYLTDDYIAKFISLSLNKHLSSPFSVSFGDFKNLISKLLSIYNEWIDLRNNNLIKYFKQQISRWKYEDNQCKINYIFKRISNRMNDVLMIRGLYKQIEGLMSIPSSAPSTSFDIFESKLCSSNNNVIWQCDDKNEALFIETKEIWFKKMRKSIKMSGEKLEKRIKEIGFGSPQLILAEFENYSILLQHDIVSKQFENHKQRLLKEMNNFFQIIKIKYEQIVSGNITQQLMSSSSSQTCRKIIACHELKGQIDQLYEINNKLIQNDLFKSNIFEIKRDLRDLTKDLFENWVNNQQQILLESGLNNKNQKVMELDLINDGELIVHYSDNLVLLINDIRILKEFGYLIPTEIQKGFETASSFYKYAIQLKQIANFYNTMSSQIIQSQKGLLLLEAQKFEQIIKNKNAVTWDKPKECDIFIKNLMNASEILAERNRRLRNSHNFINDRIKLLTDIDLFSEWNKWDQIISQISTIFNQELKSNTNKAVMIWMIYWDQSLFKIFSSQYKKCINKIENYVQNIDCNLIFDRHRKLLKFRPSLKEIKNKLNKNINKFVEKPKYFTGFGGNNSDLYSKILKEKEIKMIINGIQQKLNTMIKNLNSKTIKEYESWISFGAIDFDKEILPKLTDIDKYQEQFKLIQEKAKQTEQLPDSKKIDNCFMVSFIPFKNALDDIYHNFEDSLIISLKKNITTNINELSEYIQSGLSTLNQQPNDIIELANFKKACDEIRSNKPKYKEIFNKIHNENNVLITNLSTLIFQSQYQSSERKAVDLTEIEQKWDFFEHSMLVFDDMIDKQRDNLRTNVETKVKYFKQEMEKFKSRWNALKPKQIDENLNPSLAHQITQQIKEWRDEHTVHSKSLQQLKQECEFFGDITFDIPLLNIIDNELKQYESSWSIYSQFIKEIESMEQELWVSFRTRLLDFQDFYQLWQSKIKQIQKEHKEDKDKQNNDTVITHLKREIKQYEDIWPLLRSITGELFEKEHWSILFHKLGFSKKINLRTLTFGHLLKHKDNIIKNSDALKHLANRAQGEVTIREAIQELQVWIENEEFDITKMDNTKNKDNKIDICLIKGWKDLLVKIGDQLSLLSSLKESPYFDTFADRISSLEEKFIKLDESLRHLNQIQRKWVYLQPIFSRGALPKEQSRFARIDENFIMIMKSIETNKNVMNLLSIHNITQILSMLVDQLERCQKALSDFLEDKRSKFPRFYFLGDDDMLQILGQSMNPKVIQTHLKKLYQGIHRVTFSNDNKSIIAIQSNIGETVKLSNPVQVSSNVEVWLNNLTNQMKQTLMDLLSSCYSSYTKSKKITIDIITSFPSQILCLCQSIKFTENMEQFLINSNPTTIKSYHQELQCNLEQYTTINTNNDTITESKIKSLILDIIHHIEVIELLLENRVKSNQDWLWLKQLRFYLNKSSKQVTLKMVNAEFSYSFEYQGNASKLVHTPLTDKCYLVLTQGMHLGYGGNPYGPAGLLTN